MDTMETADSGIDMNAAQENISSDLFGHTEDVIEENEPAEEIPESEETEQEEPEGEVEAEGEDKPIDGKQPPSSWKKEMHEVWNNLDPSVQEYIHTRENQMREGLEKDRADANMGRTVRDVMTPYSDLLKSQGIDEVTGIKYLLNAHYRLSNAKGDERAKLASEFLAAYGLNNQDQQDTDPTVKRLTEELNEIKSHLSASHNRSLQEQRERVISDVEKFASDPAHSYFEDVADDVASLIRAGYSLEDAYEKAVWANPVTRQREIDRIAQDKEQKIKEQARKEAEAAKKAKSVNVRSQDTKKTPTGPLGTMEDTMRDTFRNIQNRT